MQNTVTQFCENCECVTQHYKTKHRIYGLGGNQAFIAHNVVQSAVGIPMLCLVTCVQCKNFILEYNDKVIYPLNNFSIPKPNQNLDDDLKEIYEEARAVYSLSARSSGALLRLLLQIFVNRYLKRPETANLSKGIEALMEQDGITSQIIQIMTIVRVTGNDCAHPSQLDSLDTLDEVRVLFELINLLVEVLIEKPKRIQELFDSIPDGKKPKELK